MLSEREVRGRAGLPRAEAACAGRGRAEARRALAECMVSGRAGLPRAEVACAGRGCSRPGSSLRFLFWGLWGIALLGCGRDGAHRDEASVVSRAIDQLREAENADKAPSLVALRAVSCSHPDTCGVRDRCARAYSAHHDGLKALSDARGGTDAKLQALAVTVAEGELARAKTLMSECVDAQAELIRAHKLRDLK